MPECPPLSVHLRERTSTAAGRRGASTLGALITLGIVQMFKALCAAALNVVLVRTEMRHDVWDWL